MSGYMSENRGGGRGYRRKVPRDGREESNAGGEGSDERTGGRERSNAGGEGRDERFKQALLLQHLDQGGEGYGFVHGKSWVCPLLNAGIDQFLN